MEDEEQRSHPREDVLSAIMISPNGHEHRTSVYNLSESGARVGVPADFQRSLGADLRLFFLLDGAEPVILNASLVRIAVDHLGVKFAPEQEQEIRHVMSELAHSR